MKKVPSELMKELKYISEETNKLLNHGLDIVGPINENKEFLFDSGYSYEKNQEELKTLFERERKIRKALLSFNTTYTIKDLGLTISEALIRISQLQCRIKSLTKLANEKPMFSREMDSGELVIYRLRYDLDKVKADLREAQSELSKLQLAVDAVNLTVPIEF